MRKLGRVLFWGAAGLATLAYVAMWLFFGGWWIFCFVPGADC